MGQRTKEKNEKENRVRRKKEAGEMGTWKKRIKQGKNKKMIKWKSRTVRKQN